MVLYYFNTVQEQFEASFKIIAAGMSKLCVVQNRSFVVSLFFILLHLNMFKFDEIFIIYKVDRMHLKMYIKLFRLP